MNTYDVSGLPNPPTTFEEQLIWDAIQSAGTPLEKAEAHDKLAAYYQEKGDTRRAQSERAKAAYWHAVAG